jgi:hypothetical protein
MTKSGCLALLLLLSGSIAAAAAVSEPQQTAPRSLQAGAARSDNATRTAMVYCDIKHWHSNKCMGHKLFHCDNLEEPQLQGHEQVPDVLSYKNCPGY